MATKPAAKQQIRLTGAAAIEYAADHGLWLSTYSSPLEEGRDRVALSKAREIAAEDPGLVYIDRLVWTYEGWYSCVLADSSREDLEQNLGLDTSDRVGLDEWLGLAESDAWAEGDGRHGAPIPEEWAAHHARALEELHAEGRRLRVDQENNAECWWTAARAAFAARRSDVPTVLWDMIGEHAVEAVADSEGEAEAAIAWCATLPGWADGPAYAPHAINLH